jgi:UDP-glucose 4-epimerase
VNKVVVVTGASGFIGSAVMRQLSTKDGCQALGLSRSSNDALPPHVKQIDALIHLAAYTPKSGADRDQRDEIVSSNVASFHRLLQSLPTVPKRVVFCSSLDVYAEDAFERSVDELARTAPAGLYGASKLFGESLTRAYAEQAGCEHVVLRLGHIYGPGESRYRKLVPETIRRVLRGQPPRQYGEGRDLRDLLYVGDVAEAIVRAATLPLGDKYVINIASGKSVEIRRIVQLISEIAGYRGPIEQHASASRPLSIEFDTRLMRETLGLWPTVSLEDGLHREVAWFREQHEY